MTVEGHRQGRQPDDACGRELAARGLVRCTLEPFARRVGLRPKPLLSILARRGQESAAKGPGERLMIPITTFQRDLHHGGAANAELDGCRFKPQSLYIGPRCFAGRTLEQLMEVVLGEADVTGEDVERQILIQVRLNVHQRRDDPGQRGLCFLPKNRQERVRADDYASGHDTRSRAALTGLALGVMAVNVAVSILYMVVYAYAIDPGHDQAYYEAHVKIAAPYSSIVAGIPLMFLVGWWVSMRPAILVWLVYAFVDVAALAVSGPTLRIGAFVAVSLLTKLVSAYLGALGASWRA